MSMRFGRACCSAAQKQRLRMRKRISKAGHVKKLINDGWRRWAPRLGPQNWWAATLNQSQCLYVRGKQSHARLWLQVLTNAASQMAALGSTPGTPGSAGGHSEADVERELSELNVEAARLQRRLADIEHRCAHPEW